MATVRFRRMWWHSLEQTGVFMVVYTAVCVALHRDLDYAMLLLLIPPFASWATHSRGSSSPRESSWRAAGTSSGSIW